MPLVVSDPLSSNDNTPLQRPPASILVPSSSSSPSHVLNPSKANANAPPRRRPRFTIAPSIASSGPTPPEDSAAARVDTDSSGSGAGLEKDDVKKEEKGSSFRGRVWKVLAANGVIQLDWIPGKMNWTSLKPVFRCALAVSTQRKELSSKRLLTRLVSFLVLPLPGLDRDGAFDDRTFSEDSRTGFVLHPSQ